MSRRSARRCRLITCSESGARPLTLAALQPTTPADRVLDLGTGCGIQSLWAARRSRRVVATDISSRALELAGATFALSRVENVELRHGDLYAPVAGERFDRIVSNPPFVITPRREGVPVYEYRDGGRVGDGIVEEVVRGAADHLVPGGTAHLLGNWEYRADEDGLSRVTRWLEQAGLDGLGDRARAPSHPPSMPAPGFATAAPAPAQPSTSDS